MWRLEHVHETEVRILIEGLKRREVERRDAIVVAVGCVEWRGTGWRWKGN